MQTVNHTDNAADFISGINTNLQEMGSVVVLTTAASASQVVAALNAEFNGISGVIELTTDMDAKDFVDALNGNFDIAGAGVKGQFEDEVTDTVGKLDDLITEDTFAFMLVTDIHYHPLEEVTIPALNTHFDDSVNCMKAVAKDADFDALLCLGDIIEGNPTASNSELDAEHLMTSMSSHGLPPLYVALGNHDNNRDGFSTPNETFSREKMRYLFMDYITDDVADENYEDLDYKSDYYQDFPDYNLRLIFIYGNSGTYGDGRTGNYLYNQATKNFLAARLDDLPSGYKAIVVTHVPPISKMNYNSTTRSGGETGNTTINGVTIGNGIKGIIQHYSDKVIAMFYGHCHQDNVWSDPFCCIGTCCNKGSAINVDNSKWSEDAYMPLRNAENATADLWDAVILNQEDKRIDMVRFGAGADRVIHYEPVECAAGSSVTLTSKISGGTWGLRTSDQSKASVANGVVTVGSGIASGTLLSVWCKSSDWAVNSSKQLTAGSSIEYWTIKVINT